MSPKLREVAGASWDFLFPPCCAACNAPVPPDDRDYLCRDCRSELRVLSPTGCPCELSPGAPASLRAMCALCRHLPAHFDSARSPFPYSGVIGELIRRMKYQRSSWVARVLARLSVPALGDWFHQARESRALDLVVPVPMHALRELWRGANHSEELAREFALLLGSGAPLDPLAVRRHRRTPQQSRRHGVEKRLKNVQGCFDVPDPAQVMGKRILLVDDVMTTGATATTCAQALKEAGAREVHVLTVARAGELATEPASPEMRGLAAANGASEAVRS